MKEQLRILVDLQKIDSSIFSLAEEIESLPKQLEQYRKSLKESEEAFHKFSQKSDALHKKRKEKDIELDQIQDKIKKMKAKNSEIKTNKEYEAHLKEIGSLEGRKNRIEEDILSLMEELESFEGEVEKEELKVKESEAEFKKEEERIKGEQDRLDSEIETLKAQRRETASKLDEETYDQYKQLIKRLNGLAVVEVKNEVCLGCHRNIPPQLYNNIKETGDIYTCYHCNRFLYYKGE